MKLKLVRPLIIFDLESTGKDVTTDYIVEIAFTKIFPDWSKVKKCRKIKPPISIPESASKIHGITDDVVKDEPMFKNIAKALYEEFLGCDIGGFINIQFDVPMLYAEFLRAGIVWELRDVNVIDAGVIFKRKEERTLSAAVKYYW